MISLANNYNTRCRRIEEINETIVRSFIAHPPSSRVFFALIKPNEQLIRRFLFTSSNDLTVFQRIYFRLYVELRVKKECYFAFINKSITPSCTKEERNIYGENMKLTFSYLYACIIPDANWSFLTRRRGNEFQKKKKNNKRYATKIQSFFFFFFVFHFFFFFFPLYFNFKKNSILI